MTVVELGPSAFRAALEVVSPWIGAGGLTAILVAFFTWRAQRGPTRQTGSTFAALYADHEQMLALISVLERQATALEVVGANFARSTEVADKLVRVTEQAAEATERLCTSLGRAASDVHEAADYLGERMVRLSRGGQK